MGFGGPAGDQIPGGGDRAQGRAPVSFGRLVRRYRRQCADPERGGLLTQERLGELMGNILGHSGYSGAAVSDWERDRSKIDEDDRPVLVSLVHVLVVCGGLKQVAEGDELLHAGNYRGLDPAEQETVFGPLAGHSRGVDGDGPVARPSARLEPAPAVTGEERRNLLILLDKVRRFWIEGVLESILADSTPLQLVWEPAFAMVQRPWEGVVEAQPVASQQPPSIGAEFEHSGQALLILGDAGAGKTTTLLALAAQLAARAARDPLAPVPVVLNLSSWAGQRLPLVDWASEELIAKYQIPRRIGRPWFDGASLLLLLDGFDEVPAADRPGCVRAINDFRRGFGLTGLAVCSRTSEYRNAGARLQLGGAIQLLPLSDEQQDIYLRAGAAHLATLHAAIGENSLLRELARSPLMLNLMAETFADAAELASFGAPAGEMAALRAQLFTAYERHMFEHPRAAAYPIRQIQQWLAWLAARMDEHDQSLFLLEEIQPSWLPPPERRLYLLAGHLIVGLAGGLILWLLLLLLHLILPVLPTSMALDIASWLNLPVRTTELLVLVAGNAGLSQLVFLIHVWSFERAALHNRRLGNWDLRWRALLVGLLTGLVTTAMVSLAAGFLVALSWGVATGIMYGMVSRYLFGRSYRRDIRPIEALGWSWREAGEGLLLGLLLAVAAEILETLLFGYNGAIRSLLTLGWTGFLFGGLNGNRIEGKSALNQGIRLSLRNAVAGAFIVAAGLGAITWVLRTPEAAILSALLVGLTVFPFFGGATVVKHYLVRILLARTGRQPWRHGRFLEQAAQLGLLRRVGGGYMFIHRLLQEHLAARDPQARSGASFVGNGRR
jgi:eukaryotic-like serine/threonine-protein kinase